ncbi:MAG: aminotransferase class V-fold PLP-dependent enzyme [Bacteroidia bacterium]
MYGPTGIGILFGKETSGGNGSLSVWRGNDHCKPPEHPPWKFEAGTPNVAGARRTGSSDRLSGKYRNGKHPAAGRETAALCDRAVGRSAEGIAIVGQAAEKSGIISFTWKNVHPHDIATILNESGVAIPRQSHCTQPLMQLLGLPGTAEFRWGFIIQPQT